MIKLFCISICISITVLLSGCSSKNTLSNINKNKMYELSIVNTRKAILKGVDGSKAIIIATYLNPLKIDMIDKNKEVFLVGVYIENSQKNSDNNPFYQIKLNNDFDMDSMKKINITSKYIKMIPIVNKWAEYYLIKFPVKKTRKLTLLFENKIGSKAVLNFEKEF